MSGGFVTFPRALRRGWYGRLSLAHRAVFVELLLRTRWQEEPAQEMRNGGAVVVARGQCLITQRGLAEELGLTPRALRVVLDRLVKVGAICLVGAQDGANDGARGRAQGSVYEIVDFSQFQGSVAATRAQDQRAQGSVREIVDIARFQGSVAAIRAQDGAQDGAKASSYLRREKRKEREGGFSAHGEIKASPSPEPPPPDSPPVFSLTCSDGTFEVDQPRLQEWAEAYQGIDVLSELLKARVRFVKPPTVGTAAKCLLGWLRMAKPAATQAEQHEEPDREPGGFTPEVAAAALKRHDEAVAKARQPPKPAKLKTVAAEPWQGAEQALAKLRALRFQRVAQ